MTETADRATLTHLQRLEAEAIHILREVVAEAERPVMLYSVGKDSAVMLHLAAKAFCVGSGSVEVLEGPNFRFSIIDVKSKGVLARVNVE